MRIEAERPDGRIIEYTTTQILGEGGGSVVHLAERYPGRLHETQERQAELKLVALKIADNKPSWKGRLHQEAHILRQIAASAHVGPQRIVRIQADGLVMRDRSNPHREDHDCPELIELEYLDGKTLYDWLRDWHAKPVEPLDAIETMSRYVRELLEAVSQMRGFDDVTSNAVIHRDIKPRNVMVTSRGLVLFDFNVARTGIDETMTRAIGTPRYTAPEILSGEVKSYDASVDVYSVGAIGWDILHASRWQGHLLKKNDTWPTEIYADLPAPIGDLVGRIFRGTLVEPSSRLEIDDLFDVLGELDQAIKSVRSPEVEELPDRDVLRQIDLIDLLVELRPSGLMSVVSDVKTQGALQDAIRRRTAVHDPLEDYLMARIEDALAGRQGAPRLIVLSGNAGDGKSHLLRKLRWERLVDRQADLSRIAWIADATHSARPDQSQFTRLEAFLAPFAADGPDADKAVYLIAMNTGMVIQFFEEAARRLQKAQRDGGKAPDFERIDQALRYQLGLRNKPPEAEPRFGVEVINLDMRDLLTPTPGPDGEQHCFAERMLDRLDPKNVEGLVEPEIDRCASCRARSQCPVRFNLEALTWPQVRRALLELMRRASLDPEIHLSPRNLWGFFYRLLTGGLERYETRGGETGFCNVVRRHFDDADSEWLLSGQLTEVLFSQAHHGGFWTALHRLDPAYVSVQAIDALHTRLSVNKQLAGDLIDEISERHAAEVSEAKPACGELAGAQMQTLHSKLDAERTADMQRNAAVRRQAFFDPTLFEAWIQHGGYGRFVDLLDGYYAYSLDANSKRLTPEQRAVLLALQNLVRDAFVRAHGRVIAGHRYFRMSQPNVRSTSELLVRVTDSQLSREFSIKNMLQRDRHVLVHHDRKALLDSLGYRPCLLTLSVGGHRLMVDVELHDFLLQVEAGQQPSAKDLARFQALLYIGERLGNALAADGEADTLYVRDAQGQLHELSRDAFGGFSMRSAT